MTQAGRPGLHHIPALDGVRAFAVIAVLLYHAGVAWIPGGLLGVDVFFVLSGFLITSLLLAEWRSSGCIDLRAFWARRARRLLPALFVVVGAVTAYAGAVADPTERAGLRGDALGTLSYVANWHFAFTGQDYFARSLAPSPLLHMWSLAVEEQFYLFWPVIILGLVVLARGRAWRAPLVIGVVAGVLAAMSGVLMAVRYSAGGGAAGISVLYYSTDTRAATLLIGAALAAAVVALGRRPRRRSPAGYCVQAAGLAGAATVAAFYGRVDGQAPMLYRGGFCLLAAAVAMVLASAVLAPAGPLARVLSLPPLRYIGAISYGLYLWHWPIYQWITHARTGLSGWWLLAVRLAVTFAVAVVSFRLVEQPFRTRAWRLPRPALLVPALAGGLAACVLLATAGPLSPAPFSSIAGASQAASSRGLPGEEGLPQVDAASFAAPTARPGAPRPVQIMVAGDSVARTLWAALLPGQVPYGVRLSQQTALGCGLARGAPYRVDGNEAPVVRFECYRWPEQFAAAVGRDAPDVVAMLVGRWEMVDRVHDGVWSHVGEPAYDAYIEQELDTAVRVLSSHGAAVALLTMPCLLGYERPDGGVWPEDSPERVSRFNELLRDVAARHPGRATLIDFGGMLCPGGGYTDSIGGVTVRWTDRTHIASTAGPYLEPRLLPVLRRLGLGHRSAAAAHR